MKSLPKKTAVKKQPVKRVTASNPPSAKEGDAAVKAYLTAIPGFQRGVAKKIDALVTRNVPNVQKALKWNSPFYGVEGQGWFLGLHVLTDHVKLAFLRGSSLRPMPPIETKQKEPRYLDIHESDELDEAQLKKWIKQAAALPGWMK
ncbi:MAG: DUF1801 domain-containing protein [Polyangiaceae bacterium]